MSNHAQNTQRYKKKRKTQRFVLDLYLDDNDERAIAKRLNQAKADKQLKNLIMNAVKNFKKSAWQYNVRYI